MSPTRNSPKIFTMETGWIKIPFFPHRRRKCAGAPASVENGKKKKIQNLMATVTMDCLFLFVCFEGVSKWTDPVQIYCMIKKQKTTTNVNIQYSLTENRNVVFYMIAWKE